MPILDMTGNYFDPDTNPEIAGAYDPCARGVVFTFKPHPDQGIVACSMSSIGTVNLIDHAIEVGRKDGQSDADITSKEEVANPAISNFSFIVHNHVNFIEGDVFVNAQIENGVTHVHIKA